MLKQNSLGKFLYTIFLQLYSLGIKLVSFWNDKARLWIEGRKNIFEKINSALTLNPKPQNLNLIWMHCASLGEFEQGLPLLENIKRVYPSSKIIITFFSPSGYEIKKNYKGADHIFYLPMDSAANAKKFIDAINPTLVLWIKYEYWFYYLHEIKRRNIPLLLISGVFRKDQPFFKWYGKFWKQMLDCFTHFFLQNEISADLLQQIDFKNVTLSGDTRFDRVISIKENFEDVPVIKEFCGNAKVIVAGSTWEDDEAELSHYVKFNQHIKFIIAPHEVDKENLKDVKKCFPNSIFYSELNEQRTTNNEQSAIALNPKPLTPNLNPQSAINYQPSTINCLIIDNIGMLSRLYKYAHVTYVGGGFGDDGLHNILEAAVYGKPVIFGPEFEKNYEADELIDAGGAISIENALELEKVLNELLKDETELKRRNQAAKDYVYSKAGATKKIMDFIYENRLLTN